MLVVNCGKLEYYKSPAIQLSPIFSTPFICYPLREDNYNDLSL